MLKIGYARLPLRRATDAIEREQQALLMAGCNSGLIFIEEVSARAPIAERPQLQHAKSALQRGDQLVVTDLSRLATSVHELAVLLSELKQFGRHFKSIAWDIDTASDEGWQVAKYLAPLMSFENALRLEKQKEGIVEAQAAGRFKGREPTARNRSDEVLALREQGLTIAKIASVLGIGEASVFRVLKAARLASQKTKE